MPVCRDVGFFRDASGVVKGEIRRSDARCPVLVVTVGGMSWDGVACVVGLLCSVPNAPAEDVWWACATVGVEEASGKGLLKRKSFADDPAGVWLRDCVGDRRLGLGWAEVVRVRVGSSLSLVVTAGESAMLEKSFARLRLVLASGVDGGLKSTWSLRGRGGLAIVPVPAGLKSEILPYESSATPLRSEISFAPAHPL